MLNVFKLFGVKDTDSFDAKFRHSRITLTVIYVIILAVILVISSSVTREIFSQRLHTRFYSFETFTQSGIIIERMPPPPKAEDVQSDLLNVLLIVNGSLLIIAGFVSYWLAGITLRPIKVAYLRQQQFLSDASHELRTPLAILQTDIENQLSIVKDLKHRENLLSQQEEIIRMAHLVNDLLMLSRLNEQNKELRHFKVIDLHEVVKKATDRFIPIFEQQKIDFKLVKSKNLKLTILGDETLLIQAIGNVINNAIIYNTKPGTVMVEVSQKDNQAVIAVTDTGIGMSDDELTQVFNRFYRVEKSRSRQTGGSGLGLSIVQSIIKAHNGLISIISEPSKGTTVTITLPIHKTS
jgi:signal transduction histidine kinase